jgi:predicted nucleic acid-binding Zn ribbon protein
VPEPSAGPERGAGAERRAGPERAARPGPRAAPEHGARRADGAAPGPEASGGAAAPAAAGPADQSRPAADPAGRARLAREALLRAKADSAARGNQPARTARGRPDAAGRRQRLDDPEVLNAAIAGLIDARGWQLAAAAGSMFGRWDEIVGPELAAHTRPDSFAAGELTVIADSTAWATQVRLLAAALVRRLNAELGDGAVRRVKVRGPETPRRPGQWKTRDSRGPRDTYG